MSVAWHSLGQPAPTASAVGPEGVEVASAHVMAGAVSSPVTVAAACALAIVGRAVLAFGEVASAREREAATLIAAGAGAQKNAIQGHELEDAHAFAWQAALAGL